MNGIIKILMYILALYSITSCQETEYERKKKIYESINEKYKNKGFSGISEVYSQVKQIGVYSSVYLEKRNVFSEQEVKHVSDSLQEIFLSKHGIAKDEYLTDIDSVDSYSSTLLPEMYELISNETDLRKRLYSAYKANKNVSFDDLMYYFKNYRFPFVENSGYKYVSSVNNTDVEAWMSNVDGSIFEFEHAVKKQLHDPSSFEHVETSYNTNHGEARVRMKFRAKNKLGALVLSQADGILNTSDGSVSNITVK
ncbi:hypothetical protein [Sphingobacterium thalpophilum]|uniref:hypothetical protein n=1 Tax=Sphingobacterium thalpophilum TaxID=259 RepID=UPI0024A67BE5|nr:hypothetical protein [Sphingobacterium thalpophilum]